MKQLFVLIGMLLLAVGCARQLPPDSTRVVYPAEQDMPQPALDPETIAKPETVAAAVLEFRVQNPNPPGDLSDAGQGSAAELDQLWLPSGLGGQHVQRATADFAVTGSNRDALIRLQFNQQGTQLFAKITKENIGKRIAIVVDGEIVSAPTVQTAITDGVAIISGNFSNTEAQRFADRINAGIGVSPK